jgi:uncharacterized glyoxalase superfamily metalloenzyme YdcJ
MSSSRTVSSTELRTRFAARLSNLYGEEVPAYRTLVEVSHTVNQRVIAREGAAAERLGSIDRVTAERHGAIRVGTPEELAQVSRVFAALGMSACGFYDLRDAAPGGSDPRHRPGGAHLPHALRGRLVHGNPLGRHSPGIRAQPR